MEKKNDFCPICSSHEHSFFLRACDKTLLSETFYTLAKCARCGFIYMEGYAEPEDPGIYPNDYYKEIRGLSKIFENFFLRERERFIFGFKKRGILLDIGCGTGKFMELMAAKGWEVTGVDRNYTPALKPEKFTFLCGNFIDPDFGDKGGKPCLTWPVVNLI
ncbi:MAG: methyltransferase domain-containing protein [Nitrospirae bacterium]|nr:methyltransferase domain-containing protein [Nitrospirota bacterium]